MRLGTIWGKCEMELTSVPTMFLLVELKANKTWMKKTSVPETHSTGFLR